MDRTRLPRVITQVDPELKEQVLSAAARYFEKNESMLIRHALITYLDLRESLGFDFERTMAALRNREREAIPA